MNAISTSELVCPACSGELENVADGYGNCFPCGSRWELAEIAAAPSEPGGDDAAAGGEPKPLKGQATVLTELAIASNADFFHTPAGECYAGVHVGNHIEVLALRGKAAETWLRRLYHCETKGKAPGGSAVADAMAVLRGRALFDGLVQAVQVRVAKYKDSIIIDIGDPDWRTVHVTLEGWRMLPSSPVRFRRPRGLMALPMPERGGSVADLRPFLNVEHDDDFRLLVTWLVASMFAAGPYPVLVLNGEQGAAKSTASRVLRALVDPNSAAVRSEPRDERDLVIAANNSWVLSLDNISGLRDWLSDALCRIATGGGFATRELYADAEETIFDATRPIIMNGISDVTTRGDLADRALVVHLPSINEDDRRSESALWSDFDATAPSIFGSLLDVLVTTLRNLPTVKLERLPRMADFALRGAAMAPALGWTAGDFLRSYAGSRHTAGESVLEASLLTDYIGDLASIGPGDWTGTASELLERLEHLAPESMRKKKAWPATPQRVANEIRRLAPALRGRGVEVEFSRSAGSGSRRIITVREMPQQAVASDASDATVSENGDALRRTATPDLPEASHLPRYESDGSDGCDGSMQDFSNNGQDGPRQYLVTLGEELGFPCVPGVIGAGRGAWERAARFQLDRDVAAMIKAVEAYMRVEA